MTPADLEIKYLFWENGFYAGIGLRDHTRGIPCKIDMNEETGEISAEFKEGCVRVFNRTESAEYRRFVRLFENFCKYYRESTCSLDWEPSFFCPGHSDLIAQFAKADDVAPEVL